jgi:hypothetical protein
MSCRVLSNNSITMIPANAFKNLAQLQTLFVLCKRMTVRVVAADAESIVWTD